MIRATRADEANRREARLYAAQRSPPRRANEAACWRVYKQPKIVQIGATSDRPFARFSRRRVCGDVERGLEKAAAKGGDDDV